MSTTLQRRTAKLEQAAHPDADQVGIIVRRIVGSEVVRAVIGDTVVDRRTDEAENTFMARSKAEALAGTDRRPCRMIFQPQEALQ
ncbi:MAG: hypothetical protein V5B38_22615 [Candidatus Accumulibacter propinquus]|jgi:hypothetical protein